EGVENEAQLEWLKSAGVDIAQGFLFARAVSPEMFEQNYLSPQTNDVSA
ncbi:EAL domain-containing protein, partial [Serratia marcescens]